MSTCESEKALRGLPQIRRNQEIKYHKDHRGTSLGGNCGIGTPVWIGSLDIDPIFGKTVEWLNYCEWCSLERARD